MNKCLQEADIPDPEKTQKGTAPNNYRPITCRLMMWKLFAKNRRELETLIQTVRIYSQDIGIEFGIEKCAMLIRKSRRWHMMEEPNQEKIRTLREKETNKYLVILEADTIKQVDMKGKMKKEYLRRMRKLLKTKLYSRNLINGINTWAVPIVRYSDKWTREQENSWWCIRLHIPDCMYQEKKREEDLSVFRITLMWCIDTTIRKQHKKDWLQPLETIQTTQIPTDKK